MKRLSKQQARKPCFAVAILLGAVFVAFRVDGQQVFNYSDVITGSNPLSITITTSFDGTATVNGYDPRQPTTPSIFTWGDGAITSGFFPQSHLYADKTRNYVVVVTSTYAGSQSSCETVARFVAPTVNAVALDPDFLVTIPRVPPTLTSRLYSPPVGLEAVPDSAFTLVPRETVEYVLSVAAVIEIGFASGDVFRPGGSFNQVVLRDPALTGGGYSLWFTNPVALAGSPSVFTWAGNYSSLFHEMGHNVTLNMPARYYYGGKIDGPANAIYSETMAQIFQHAAAYEIVNNAAAYGLSSDLSIDIQQSARASALGLVQAYKAYLASGSHFESWSDSATSADETLGTFMTIAYKFLEHAEAAHAGYRTPLSRMTSFLRRVQPSWMVQYSQGANSAAAESFRATLMVTALSYAFSEDLRGEFRDLGLPISDQTYGTLLATVVPTCQQDALTACLIGGRYKVTSHWQNQYAGRQVSTLSAGRLTDATAAFWLSDSNTFEYLIRINTATDNGRAWIAIPTFTDVEFWIEVTDTTSGQYYEYHSPAGNRTLIYDPYYFVFR